MMAKALIESLQLDLPALAKIIQSKGKKGDTILAHINPREAALLKRRGGSGTINPETGLPQFDDGFDAYAGGGAADIAAQNAANQTPSAPVSPVYDIAQQGGAFTQVQGGTGQQYTPGGADYAPISAVPAFNPETYGVQGQPSVGPIGVVPAGQQLPTGGTVYAPTTLTPTQLGQAAVGQQVEGYPGPTTPTPTQDQTKTSDKILGMSPDTLARLGLAGGLGLYGAGQYKKGVTQTQAATGEQKAVAQPYQAAGQNLVRAASAGELTPQSVQSYKALQAQLAQGVANRGGVGAEQAANQLEAFRQTLLTNQYNYGLQVSQIGDQIALGAIRTGMQLDQQLNNASNQFYTNLAGIAAGLPMARTV
jgi:hypothetical protein